MCASSGPGHCFGRNRWRAIVTPPAAHPAADAGELRGDARPWLLAASLHRRPSGHLGGFDEKAVPVFLCPGSGNGWLRR